MLDPDVIPLVSLRAFEAAARLGSFAAAARELRTTAASVSYHVTQLERWSGLVLFRRLPHRVELTEPGADIAAETIRTFSALKLAFSRTRAVEDTRLSISALPTFGASWLTPRLVGFRAQHPHMQISLDLSAEPRDLSSGLFDAAIRNGYGNWPGLSAKRLFPSVFTPLCAPAVAKHVSAALREGRLPDDVPLLGRRDWWALWRTAFGDLAALPDHRFGVTLAEEHLDAAAASSGGGLTIGSPILFAAEIAAGRLEPVHDLLVSDGKSFWLAYPSSKRSSARIALFEHWLLAEVDAVRTQSPRGFEEPVVIAAPSP